MWIFSDIFIILENPVYRKMIVVFANRFDRNFQQFSSVVRSLFTKTWKFPDLMVFFKNKKKNRKVEKICKSLYIFGQIDNSILGKKS